MSSFQTNVTKEPLRLSLKLASERILATSPSLSVIHSNMHTMPQVTDTKPKSLLVKVRSIVISDRPARPATLSDTGYTWVG